MSHTQPSPTASVAHHQAHMATHPQVNGHMPPMPAQAGQKAVSLTTAQKITALNEQVWLHIGMNPLKVRDAIGYTDLSVYRQLD